MASTTLQTTSVSKTLLSSNDNLKGAHNEHDDRGAHNIVLMGALAAAGLGAEPLAAHEGGAHEHGHSIDQTMVHTEALTPIPLDGAELHTTSVNVAALAGVASGGHTDPQHQAHGESHSGQATLSRESTLSHGLTPLSHGESSVHSGHSAGNVFTASGIHVPSAAQLHALSQHGGEHTAHVETHVVAGVASGAGAEQVGQVLSDALPGGHGQEVIESVLQNLSGKNEPADRHGHLASHDVGGVSDGDNGHLAAFASVHHASLEHAIAMAHVHAAAHPHG
jgi:hypothetical protein